MRISFVTLNVSLGSIIYSNIKFAERLIAEGHEVDFVGIEDIVDEDRSAFPNGVVCFALKAYRVRQGPLAIRKYVIERQPDAIVVSGQLQGLIVAVGCQLIRRSPNLTLKIHVSNKEYLTRQVTFFDRHVLTPSLRYLTPAHAKFAAVSEAGACELRAELGLPASRVRALLDPVLPIAFRDGDPARHPWLEDATLKVALFVGRYHEQKDIPTLLDAFAIVADRDPAWRLLMYGKGEAEQAMREKVAALGLEERVAILGYVDPLLAYRKADVFVVSSTYEGLCNVIIEAMNEGCRVVSTDCPVGPREVLEDGMHGQLVPVGDVPALAAAILRAPELPYDREAAKRRAQDFHLDAVWPVFANLIGLNQLNIASR